jgi:hypothetical protein
MMGRGAGSVRGRSACGNARARVLKEPGVPLEYVQRLAGPADPRTTRLYDRRDKKIMRNI